VVKGVKQSLPLQLAFDRGKSLNFANLIHSSFSVRPWCRQWHNFWLSNDLRLDIAVLASFQQGFHHELDRFPAACDQTGIKISIEKNEILCLFGKPSQFALRVSGNRLQQV